MTQIVTEKEVEKALDFLRDSAADLGRAKAEALKAEHMVKVTRAIAMQQHLDKPVSAQEREALTTPQYLEAIDKASEAAGEYETMRARREAALYHIEAWRSQSATFRSMKL